MFTPTKPSRSFARAIATMFGELWQPPGLALALCTPSGIAWHVCRGHRRLGDAALIDPTTVFALASGTKTMAAATIAHLVDRHEFDWDTPVTRIDPGFDAGDARVTQAITLRDLACHRTGWTSSEGRHRGAATSRSDLVSRLRHHGFRHPFREQFGYCTDGFTVLGHLVDLVSKHSWEDYTRTHLFAPLGMTNTHLTVRDALASSNFATPHLRIREGTAVAVPWYYEDGVATPAGGANSCVADLGRWLAAWLTHSHAVPWSLHQQGEMLEPQISNSGAFADSEFSCAVAIGNEGITDKAYALGWYTHRYRGELVYHHTGSIRGFRSLIALLPERKLGFVALVNADAVFLPRALFQALIDDLQGSDALKWTTRFFDLESAWHEVNATRSHGLLPTPHAVAPPDLPGTYRDDGRFGTVRITSHAPELAFEAGNLRYVLVPRDGAQLACYEPCGPLFIEQGCLRIESDAAGAVAGFTLQDAAFRRM